jgi:PAS domain S-box-containing protein
MMVAASGVSWERLFWHLFERTTNPVALLDESRTVVAINDAALDLLGQSRGQMIGSGITHLIAPRERAEAEARWERFLASGEDYVRRTFVRPDGSEIVLSFAGRMASIGDRRLAVVVVLRADATELSSAEEVSGLPLTGREREVVTLIALGRATATIASELHISSETVKTHVRNAMRKLDAHTRAELVAVALSTEHAIDVPRLRD